jgi:hypothetical protein
MDFQKLFTLQEAIAILPEVRELIQKVVEHKKELDSKRHELGKLETSKVSGNGHEIKREHLATKIVELRQNLEKVMDAIHQIGCQVKDLDMGLVDFPAQRAGGEIVNLCWHMGEEGIEYWHTLDTGFMSRRPISEF